MAISHLAASNLAASNLAASNLAVSDPALAGWLAGVWHSAFSVTVELAPSLLLGAALAG